MNDKIVILTKQEIGDAITMYIGLHKERMLFFPFYITKTDQELHLPEDVMFTLSYIPKGTKSGEETKHAL